MAMSDYLFHEKDKLRGLVPTSGEGKKDEVYGSYLECLGVETSLTIQQQLALSPDLRFKKFLELMGAPKRVVKVQTLAKQCGIDLVEFQNWFSKAASAIAIAEAQRRAAGIVTDMAVDALSKDEFCERCDGLTWVAAPEGLPVETQGYRVLGFKQTEEGEKPIWGRTCPKCRGVGTVRAIGDEHSRDRVLEIAGLVTKGGKGNVQIVQNFGGAAHTSAVSGSLSAMTIDVELDADTTEGEV